jgi:hypothetical protein
VNNTEWVLVLSEIVHSEADRSPEIVLYTERIPDETLILYFAPDKDSFRLAWSNLGGWSWTPLVRVNFHRVLGREGAAGRARDYGAPREPRVLPPRKGESTPEGSPDKPRATTPPKLHRGIFEGRKVRPLLASDRGSPQRAEATETPSPRITRRKWQVGGWGRPATFWNARR